jgi:nucleoside-diphosphate-sugar epimerase
MTISRTCEGLGGVSARSAPVMVTGASGFLGRTITSTLLAAGWRVRACVRDPAYAPPGATAVVVSDLLDEAALTTAAEGCRAIVHSAGLAHIQRRDAADEEAFRRVNVLGTHAIVDAAARAGVSTLVHLSSIAVFPAHATVIEEETETRAETAYGRSKLAAENVIREGAACHGMWAPILRPPMVYGPGMKGNPLRLFRLVDRGVPLPFGALRAPRSVLYSGNLGKAVAALLSHNGAGSATMLIADGRFVTVTGLIEMIAEALDRPARLVPIPPRMLGVAATAAAALGLSPFASALEKLTGGLLVVPRRLASDVGYSPSISTKEGIRRTAEWFQTSMVDRRRGDPRFRQAARH